MNHKKLKIGDEIILDNIDQHNGAIFEYVGDEKFYRGKTIQLKYKGEFWNTWEVVAPRPSFKEYLTGKE